MGDHYKIDCAREEDRAQLAVILVRNGYTVRYGREKRGNSSAYTHFIEDWR